MDETEIASAEIERKNLENTSSFPISCNLGAWNSLRKYRFWIMNDKNIDILEKWPTYSHSDGACLVNYNTSLFFLIIT